ncbi:hypothetical protein ACLKMH_13375 [Psychromonas sp. KJ10-10]|uniref:hypothetical protein n=1 Tax=Psychromonas sp. KJ10-10 TaxID=3391823 RepID=UPI0039B5A9AB
MNREQKRAFKELRQSIEHFDGNCFLLFCDYQELEGATPEAYNEVCINNNWLMQKNIVAKAIVFASDTVKNIGFKHVPQEGINSKVFKCKDTGMQWLNQQMNQSNQ